MATRAAKKLRPHVPKKNDQAIGLLSAVYASSSSVTSNCRVDRLVFMRRRNLKGWGFDVRDHTVYQ